LAKTLFASFCRADGRCGDRRGGGVEAALAARYGEADVVTLEPSKEVYYKHEFDREGVKFIVEFSKEKKILGVWAMIPCPKDEAATRIAALKDRVIALYRDKLESCGATKGAEFAASACLTLFISDLI